jgi:TRAP-type mannitol/chloroaromatic compound transport system permease small subunit
MDHFLKVIDTTNDWLGKKVSFLIIFIFVIMTFETFMRYAINAPTTWVSDLSWIVCGIYFLIGGAYTARQGSHVNMDVIYKRFSLRGRAIVDLCTAIVFFIFCIVIIRYATPFALRSIGLLETTLPPSLLPIYFTKAAIPIGVFLLALQGLSKFIKDFRIAITGRAE